MRPIRNGPFESRTLCRRRIADAQRRLIASTRATETDGSDTHSPNAHGSAAGLFALAALFCVPLGLSRPTMLLDDAPTIRWRSPTAGSPRSFDATVAQREIEAALAADDADLAKSFLDLADGTRRAVPPELAGSASPPRSTRPIRRAGAAESFARGLITGEPDDMVEPCRHRARRSVRVRRYPRRGARGQPLRQRRDGRRAGAGASPASASRSPPAPMRASARRRRRASGFRWSRPRARPARIGGALADWVGRSLREVIDWSALRRAGRIAGRARGRGARGARSGQGREGRRARPKLVGDVGRVQSQGRHASRARRAEARAKGRARLPRIAKLAEKKGSKTRAILKTLGRGRDPVCRSPRSISRCGFSGAIADLVGLVSSAKSAVERMTLRHLARKKAAQAVPLRGDGWRSRA